MYIFQETNDLVLTDTHLLIVSILDQGNVHHPTSKLLKCDLVQTWNTFWKPLLRIFAAEKGSLVVYFFGSTANYSFELIFQFVILKPLSYCFEETIGFEVKASFSSRPMSRLIRWHNKPGDITKEFWKKAIQFQGTFHGLKITNWFEDILEDKD